MTNEEAIIHFKEQLEVFGGEHHEAMKVAIEALEKQIPKKPIANMGDFWHMGWCPHCNGELGSGKTKHCHRCGQAIDWSE